MRRPFVLIVPLLGPASELIEMIRNNLDSADTRGNAQATVHSLWDRALLSEGSVKIEDCRAVQDQILSIRQTNAHVPDWADDLYRSHNESIMQDSATHSLRKQSSRARHADSRFPGALPCNRARDVTVLFDDVPVYRCEWASVVMVDDKPTITPRMPAWARGLPQIVPGISSQSAA